MNDDQHTSRNDTVEKIQLICLPFAGAGASFFNEWRGIDDSLDVRAVQLPGREKRFLESPHVDVRIAADEAIAMLVKEGDTGLPSMIFGHSLGAVLAFELARRWERVAPETLLGVIVSGSPAPSAPRESHASAIADNDSFVAKVAEFSGFKHEALADPMMRELLLPTLRADVFMHENYKASPQDVLSAPILAVRGSDDELVSRTEVETWEGASLALVHYDELPGGHMYFTDATRPLIDRIAGFGHALASARSSEAVL